MCVMHVVAGRWDCCGICFSQYVSVWLLTASCTTAAPHLWQCTCSEYVCFVCVLWARCVAGRWNCCGICFSQGGVSVWLLTASCTAAAVAHALCVVSHSLTHPHPSLIELTGGSHLLRWRQCDQHQQLLHKQHSGEDTMVLLPSALHSQPHTLSEAERARISWCMRRHSWHSLAASPCCECTCAIDCACA